MDVITVIVCVKHPSQRVARKRDVRSSGGATKRMILYLKESKSKNDNGGLENSKSKRNTAQRRRVLDHSGC